MYKLVTNSLSTKIVAAEEFKIMTVYCALLAQ